MRPRQTSARNSSRIIPGNIWIKSPSGNEALTEDRAGNCCSTCTWQEELRVWDSLLVWTAKAALQYPAMKIKGCTPLRVQRSRQRQENILINLKYVANYKRTERSIFKVITKAVSAQFFLTVMEVFCLNLQALGWKYTTPRRAGRWGVGVRMGEQINQQLKIYQVG